MSLAKVIENIPTNEEVNRLEEKTVCRMIGLIRYSWWQNGLGSVADLRACRNQNVKSKYSHYLPVPVEAAVCRGAFRTGSLRILLPELSARTRGLAP